ncbi:MAG: DUF1036 domain-containing protein [Pseudomonadota bacterium]
MVVNDERRFRRHRSKGQRRAMGSSKNLFCFVTLVVGTLFFSGSAFAKYSLCNKTSYVLSASIAYVDGDRLATRGWWRLRPGECKVVLTEATDPGRYFVYAEAIPGHKGPLRAWSGDTPLCVEKEGFFNLRNQDTCKNDPSSRRNFFTVDVTAEAKGNWQTDFAEAENYSVFSAEVAGIQRLMSDVGASKGRIDGSLGRQTQRDLATYRNKAGLGAGPVIDNDTIDHLIDKANSAEAKLGFFYCNKTDTAVWSAIAEAVDKTYKSSGWWKLEPEECTKVIKGALQKDHYYVYGVVSGPSGERRLAGGDKSLCVNDVKFAIDNDTSCADQELDEAIFKRVDIGSLTSHTFEFQANMFVGPPTTASR